MDRLCGLVVRVPGNISRDPGFDSRGPLSLVRITEEPLEWKSSGSRSREPRLTAVGDPLR
jgi:hypothetical protein